MSVVRRPAAFLKLDWSVDEGARGKVKATMSVMPWKELRDKAAGLPIGSVVVVGGRSRSGASGERISLDVDVDED